MDQEEETLVQNEEVVAEQDEPKENPVEVINDSLVAPDAQNPDELMEKSHNVNETLQISQNNNPEDLTQNSLF